MKTSLRILFVALAAISSAVVLGACSRGSVETRGGADDALERGPQSGGRGPRQPPRLPPPTYLCPLALVSGSAQCSLSAGGTAQALLFHCGPANDRGLACTATPQPTGTTYACPNAVRGDGTVITCQTTSGAQLDLQFVDNSIKSQVACNSSDLCAKDSTFLGAPADGGVGQGPAKCCTVASASVCLLPAFGCDKGYRYMTYDPSNAPYAGYGNCVPEAPTCAP
jgi:hypothetical protein